LRVYIGRAADDNPAAADGTPALSKGLSYVKRMGWIPPVVVLVLVATAWANDFIMLQGERTIYTAGCEQGAWAGKHCTGKLVAAERYRFRALKAHNEVFFWTAGASSEPVGRFTQCMVQSASNWVCQPNADVGRSITLEMSQGRAVPDPGGKTRPFHPISKVHWLLLNNGWSFSSDADG
jgi:hypothetical protein